MQRLASAAQACFLSAPWGEYAPVAMDESQVLLGRQIKFKYVPVLLDHVPVRLTVASNERCLIRSPNEITTSFEFPALTPPRLRRHYLTD